MKDPKFNIDSESTSDNSDPVMDEFHDIDTDDGYESDAYDEEEEEKEKVVRIYNRGKAMRIIAIESVVFIMLIVATIAWFSMGQNIKTDEMLMESQGGGFDLRVDGIGVIGYSELYQNLDPELSSNSGTTTSDEEGEQVIRWRMETGDDELQPGSQGELHFDVISNGADLSQLEYRLNLASYHANTHTVSSTDEHGNPIETEVVDSIEEITSGNNYSGVKLDAARYINGHVLYFTGRHGSSKDDYEYYGFIDNKERFNLNLVNGAGTIYWIWPNTLGQITLESTDTGYISGSPVLYKGETEQELSTYESDRAKLTAYLKTRQSDIFSGTESYSALIDSLYSKKESATSYKTEFDKLSEGYNAADQTIGKNVDFVLIQMIVDSN